MPSRTKKNATDEQWTIDSAPKGDAAEQQNASEAAADPSKTKSTRTRRKTTRKKTSAQLTNDSRGADDSARQETELNASSEQAIAKTKTTRTRRKTASKKAGNQQQEESKEKSEASDQKSADESSTQPVKAKTARTRRKTASKKSSEQLTEGENEQSIIAEGKPADESLSKPVKPKTTRTRRKTASKTVRDQQTKEGEEKSAVAEPKPVDEPASEPVKPKTTRTRRKTTRKKAIEQPAPQDDLSAKQEIPKSPIEPAPSPEAKPSDDAQAAPKETATLEASKEQAKPTSNDQPHPKPTSRKRRSRGGRSRSRGKEPAEQKTDAAAIDSKAPSTDAGSQTGGRISAVESKTSPTPTDTKQETAVAPDVSLILDDASPVEDTPSAEASAGEVSTPQPTKRRRRSRGGRGRNRKRREGVVAGEQTVAKPQDTPEKPTDAVAETPADSEPESPSEPVIVQPPSSMKSVEPPTEAPITPEEQSTDAAEAPPTRKRRRSRGGRGRNRNRDRNGEIPTEQPKAQEPVATESQPATEEETPSEKAPYRRMIFSQEAGYEIAAIADNGRLTDFWIQEEKRADQGAAGNIYRGVVSRVIPALNAAFVDIGLGKEGFLSYSDLGPEIYRLRQSGKKGDFRSIESVLNKGDAIMVQLAKEAIGDKGPALSAKISLPGRFLVYMPYVKVMRMSRQLNEAEKKKLSVIYESQKDLDGGVIFRTAAKGQSETEIQNDFNYLKKIWTQAQKDFQTGEGPKLLHKELDLFERALRDHFNSEVAEVVVYHSRIKQRIARFYKKIYPNNNPDEIINVNPEKLKSVWKTYNLEKDIDQLFSNIVSLDCGGYMIIEEMETLTAIDINSGGNVLRKNLDETIYQTNLEAAVEVTRQMRLRQLGGIIIIDFIDMAHKRHQEQVFRTLERELEKDRTPSDLQQFTELGLIQITRQRTGRSLTKRLTFNCPHCHGSGRLPSIQMTDKKK